MQSIAEIKSNLHHYIAELQDFELLSNFQKYIKAQIGQENKIIGYTMEGKPLNQSAFSILIDEAITEADSGELIDQEEIEKEL